MQIEDIILELREKGVIAPGWTWQALSGGTVSSVYALRLEDEPKLVVKMNEPKLVQCEVSYLTAYAGNPLFSQVAYIDPDYRYFVYAYQPGDTTYPNHGKAELLLALVHGVINRVQLVHDSDTCGYQDEPSASWQDFFMLRYRWARESIGTRLPDVDHQLVRQLIHATAEPVSRYLLHGDFGIHNFLFQDGRLSGVIDPIPTIGEPLYDLIYAYCSSPDDLTLETIQPAVEAIDPKLGNGMNLIHEVLIGLYYRMATCILHHPQDFDAYIEAWTDWKKRY